MKINFTIFFIMLAALVIGSCAIKPGISGRGKPQRGQSQMMAGSQSAKAFAPPTVNSERTSEQ